MKVLDFRFLSTEDICDDELFNDGHAWSRCYEYPIVLNLMDKYLNTESTVHNSSWGFQGIHTIFKESLDKKYKNVLHSDIKFSNLPNTMVYNILEEPPEKFKNYFDCVLNISTVEEVGGDHTQIIKNLYNQVKAGGYLICTFDYPGIQLEKVENFINKKIKIPKNLLNGSNSVVKNNRYSNLNCGLLVIENNITACKGD